MPNILLSKFPIIYISALFIWKQIGSFVNTSITTKIKFVAQEKSCTHKRPTFEVRKYWTHTLKVKSYQRETNDYIHANSLPRACICGVTKYHIHYNLEPNMYMKLPCSLRSKWIGHVVYCNNAIKDKARIFYQCMDAKGHCTSEEHG